jgi:hypothetical protein
MACFGKAFHKVAITAKTRLGNRNHLSEMETIRQYEWSWLSCDGDSSSCFDGASAIKTAPMIAREGPACPAPTIARRDCGIGLCEDQHRTVWVARPAASRTAVMYLSAVLDDYSRYITDDTEDVTDTLELGAGSIRLRPGPMSDTNRAAVGQQTQLYLRRTGRVDRGAGHEPCARRPSIPRPKARSSAGTRH